MPRDDGNRPSSPRAGEVTRLLLDPAEDASGERNARLLALLYEELRGVAERFLAGERPDHTLQPTALVHEAYLRLVVTDANDGAPGRFEGRQHFLATAARAMRNLLVDHARGRLRSKRGGDWGRVDLTVAEGLAPAASESHDFREVDLIALDAALAELVELSEREARVVEMRSFAGLDDASIAEVLGVSERTVRRDWRHARAWLARRLEA